MPRGWLKHKSRLVGKKAGRGGGSARNKDRRKKLDNHPQMKGDQRAVRSQNARTRNSDHCLMRQEKSLDYYYSSSDHLNDYDDEVDNSCSEPSAHLPERAKEECPICCEYRVVVPFMKKCSHPPACRNCLREIFVNQAQQHVSNYPLRCYHPDCRKPVVDEQLIRHGLVNSDKEMIKHYRLTNLSKVYADPFMKRVVDCPECNEPRAVRKNQTQASCRQCNKFYLIQHEGVTNLVSTIAAMESFKKDKFGRNDGLARCPRCNMMISKGGGCDHMSCFCGHDFSWEFARHNQPRSDRRQIATATAKTILS